MMLALSATHATAYGAIATMAIALVAVLQIVQSRRQTNALEDQIAVIRDTAADELSAVREQIAASVAQNEAVREAARAQLQPIVFAYGDGPPRNAAHLPLGGATFRYYLKNEGVGPALDIEHGIRIGGREHTIDDQEYRYRTLSVGEVAPPGYPEKPGGPPLQVDARYADQEVVFWARFSNIFGERFEVHNYRSASKPAEFVRLDDPA